MTVEPSIEASPQAPFARGDAAEPILRTENLTVRFGGLSALNGVNFAVQRDEIRAIIGPNGAGKSTLFNCLTGVLRPTAGHIRFAGDDITGLSPDRISQKGIARSYQITNILPNATVLDSSSLSTSVTWNSTNSPYTVTNNNGFPKPLGNTVSVTVTYTWMPEIFFIGPITLSSTSTLPMAY